MNLVLLSGWVSSKLEESKSQAGITRVQFYLNCDHGPFVRIVCWARLAEYVRDNMQEGDWAVVRGRLRHRKVRGAWYQWVIATLVEYARAPEESDHGACEEEDEDKDDEDDKSGQ